MGNKRSLGVRIISSFEMVIGFLGVALATPFLWLFFFGSESDGKVEGLAIALTWGVPAATLLIMGELTFHLKPAGRIMHLIIPAVVVILLISQFMMGIFTLLLPDLNSFPLIIIICLMGFLVYFFSIPEVREQFR